MLTFGLDRGCTRPTQHGFSHHHDHDHDRPNPLIKDSDDVVMTLQPQSIPGAGVMAHLTLTLTHPSTPHRQLERENRMKFRNWLSLLDDCAGVDGVVTLPSPPSTTNVVSFASSPDLKRI
eukprot:scaffold2235_cov201-Skeletonema_marinoi.AAC.8